MATAYTGTPISIKPKDGEAEVHLGRIMRKERTPRANVVLGRPESQWAREDKPSLGNHC